MARPSNVQPNGDRRRRHEPRLRRHPCPLYRRSARRPEHRPADPGRARRCEVSPQRRCWGLEPMSRRLQRLLAASVAPLRLARRSRPTSHGCERHAPPCEVVRRCRSRTQRRTTRARREEPARGKPRRGRSQQHLRDERSVACFEEQPHGLGQARRTGCASCGRARPARAPRAQGGRATVLRRDPRSKERSPSANRQNAPTSNAELPFVAGSLARGPHSR